MSSGVRNMCLILFFIFKFLVAEGRVFCEDSNASPWDPLGQPCPISCGTIVNAIDNLRKADYQLLLNISSTNKFNISAKDLYTLGLQVFGRSGKPTNPELKKHIKLYNTYNRLLNNDKFPNALKIEMKKMAVELKLKNRTCSYSGWKPYNKLLRYKCTRRLNKKPEVMEKFMRFLNFYADPRYPFDEEMAGIILLKLESHLNLRFGEVDFKRVLSYLKKTLRYHGAKTSGRQIINLQPKNCMTMYLPGCHCKPGYVEFYGQCVKPESCINNPKSASYLERIIIH